ncbi:MAG: hypothetical protein K2I06_09380, partial [Ruminococcus sp.]|nr:hypothetical protein [Ruminococcus sp.]
SAEIPFSLLSTIIFLTSTGIIFITSVSYYIIFFSFVYTGIAVKAIHTVEYDNVALKVMNKALEDKRKALEQDV